MARARAGRTTNELGRKAALLAAAVILTGCASSLPTAPDDTGMHKWNGEPVVTTDKHYAPGSGVAAPRTGPARP